MKLILLLTVLLIPLLKTAGNFGYEQIKVSFFIFSITLIGLFWRGKGFRWTLISKTAGVFILILLTTSLMGIDSESSVIGNQPYFQGWILYACLYLFFIMVSSVRIKLEHWAYVLTGSAALVGILAIKDWVLLNLFHQQVAVYAGRVVSTFGQPNFYAGFLLFTLPFAYYLFKNSVRVSQGHSLSTPASTRGEQGVTLNKLNYFGLISGLISFIGIMVSYSRTSVFLSLILLILALIDQLKIKKILVVSLFILIGAVFLSINFSSGFVWKEFLQPLATSNPDLTKESVENRIYIWPQAFKIGLQKPFTGFGLENIHPAFSTYFNQYKHSLFEENLKISPVLISLKELNIDRSHNYILDLLLFSGVFGLLVWIFLVGLLFWKLKQKTIIDGRQVLMVSLITYLIWVQFQNQSVIHLIYFWLLAGLIDRGNK